MLEDENTNKEKSKGAIKKAKTKTQSKKTISIQKSVISNAITLYDKINIIIDAFINKDIMPEDLEKDVNQEEEPEYEENIAERIKMRRQSRLPISLVQLKARNNSEKLKSEIRQLLYSLYRSKKLRKRCMSI